MLAPSNGFKLTNKQLEAIELFSSEATYILLYGGSRSTKTFTTIRTIVNRALAVPESRHAILRFRFNHIKASVVHDTFPKVMRLCFPGCPYKLNQTDWFVEFPNKSQIWFGGLDDKERAEKILGNEYATIMLNEISQISYNSFTIMITRLAQLCHYEVNGVKKELRLKFFLDENPPSKGHWSYKLFIEKRSPDSKASLENPEDYASMLMNPADNAANLPATYLKALQNLPKRKRDRFWDGKFGDDTENALWSSSGLDASRVNGDDLPDFVRVIVSVDPSGSGDEDNAANDAIGIVVAALGTDGIGYLLEDVTLKAGPATWGKVATSAYERHEADRIIGEQNFGGAMVEFVVKAANPNVSYKSVNASRGKVVRAEPISALHESGKIKLVGTFADLEDELVSFTTTGYIGENSPNRADAFVWAFTELFPGMTQKDKKVKKPIVIPNLKRF